MPVESDSYDDAVTLVGNRRHLPVIQHLRKHPGSRVADIFDSTGIPLGTLGRILRLLVDLEVLTIDVKPENRSTGRSYRYAVNDARVADLLAALHGELIGRR